MAMRDTSPTGASQVRTQSIRREVSREKEETSDSTGPAASPTLKSMAYVFFPGNSLTHLVMATPNAAEMMTSPRMFGFAEKLSEYSTLPSVSVTLMELFPLPITGSCLL